MTEEQAHKHVRHFHEGRSSCRFMLSLETETICSYARISDRDQACRIAATIYLSGVVKHMRLHFFPKPDKEETWLRVASGKTLSIDRYVQGFIDEKIKRRER